MRKAYLLAGRIASPLFVLFLRLFTLLTGVERVRVMVINEDNEVLLVRGVISDGKWSLPGGGVARGEEPAAAARRELFEETGIDAPERAFHYLETLDGTQTDVSYRAPLYLLHSKRNLLPAKAVNPWEISQVQWFPMDDLPKPLSRLSLYALSKHKNEIVNRGK